LEVRSLGHDVAGPRPVDRRDWPADAAHPGERLTLVHLAGMGPVMVAVLLIGSLKRE
jgi:hypothetical protein